ncbi:outer membrane protein assembly factor BamD [Paramagnetospirillum magneticum]|uniref:Outer membrane protein assembly factor BamD n=1 Tax=Paramagnetospirillum magneticum (strain ATCC 700264 / AMB-1) TaxID=342108 RepID=Q2W0G5_PARM1|nr:outer membrane protein assembly factor BamD [Paramagnetospirillum magneticum]BAE52660.1 DNA uptake lipoprotein [Paramagnetospirillum magneticum AMB-1]
MRHRSATSRLLPALALSAALAAGLGACSEKKPEYVERPVEELYNEAMDLVDANEYYKAAQLFDEVDRQHPYSVWATKAQLMSAYALYERNKYDDAIVALDRFIQLHPGNKSIAYGYYLKGLCYYEQITDVARDQKLTEQALKIMQEVVDRFPSTPYARDARLKIDLARDHLAGKEMNIGRYYQHLEHHLAALNRFKVVAEQYQTTTHVPEALYRMVEIYTALGLDQEAARAAAVLGHNFPGSDWYEDAYAMVEKGNLNPTGRSKKHWTDPLVFWSNDKDKRQEIPKADDPAKTSGGWFNWAKFW